MQGSVLGPLLFIMYTTPLISCYRAGFDVSSLLSIALHTVITPIGGLGCCSQTPNSGLSRVVS